MKQPDLRFPAFGSCGDHIGARRMRRAFRLCVLALVAFTSVLWIGERFLRYELPERLYLTSLTHYPESARVFLRQAVIADEAKREFPTPRYLEALAEREEQDQILPTYERAHKLDPDNASLSIRHGCRLVLEQQYAEARRQFAEASKNAPKNALPMYLEAAVLPWLSDPAGEQAPPDVAASLALVARTNSSGNPVTFPKPLWHADLPQRGIWYANLRRQIIDDCCAPLFQYRDFVVNRATQQLANGQVQYWDSWLETLDSMGMMVADGALPSQDSPGAPLAGAALAAQAGLTIRLAALTHRERIHEIEGGAKDTSLSERRASVESALTALQQFENARDARITESRAACFLPRDLIAGALGALLLSYFLASLLSKLFRADAAARAIAYPRWCLALLLVGALLLLALLAFISAGQETLQSNAPARRIVESVWWAVFALWLGFGVLFPSLALPSARAACEGIGDLEEMDETLKQARRYRRGAYFVLIRRYSGAAFGLLVCVTCAWVIGHRVITAIYPWQLELLVTGLALEEAEAARHALLLLK